MTFELEKPYRKAVDKLSSFTHALSEYKKFTDIRTALYTFYAYAEALLRYSLTLWGNSNDIHIVFTLQKSSSYHYIESFKKLDIICKKNEIKQN